VIDPSPKRGLRDRALLLVVFAGAFRRSELVGIDLEHIADNARAC
jgi:site-specific recombinase XerD